MEIQHPNLDSSIFDPNHNYNYGWGYHNVAANFDAGERCMLEKISAHHGQRCGHLPDTPNIGILVEATTSILSDQINYLSRMLKQPISIQQINQPAPLTGLAVPYLNTTATEQTLNKLGLDVWGLPSLMVERTKNKADFHQDVRELGIDNFAVPDFRVVPVDQLVEAGNQYLTSIENLYSWAGLRGCYPVGLMLRSAQSAANYGSCSLVEAGKRFVLMENGDPNKAKTFDGPLETLKAAKNYIKGSALADTNVESRVIMTRFMKLAESPGLSVVIFQGEIYPLSWNGQVTEDGGTTCIGTSSYNLTKNGQTARLDLEPLSTEAFGKFLRAEAKFLGIDFKTISGGVANIDIMVPGHRERYLQRLLNQHTPFLIAEANPRWTNWTDALSYCLGTKGVVRSVNNFRSAINDGVLTLDAYPFPTDTPLSRIREVIEALDNELEKEGTRILVRMIDNPTGLIITGDIKLALDSLNQRKNLTNHATMYKIR